MVDEASRDICRQIVFLIDSNPSFWGSSCSLEDTSNAIRLCVLTILTYFSNNGEESDQIYAGATSSSTLGRYHINLSDTS